MKCPKLLLCVLVGCASPPVVPLPVALPRPTHYNKPAPPQPFYLTEDERQALMAGMTDTSRQISERSTAYWNNLWSAFVVLDRTQQHLYRLMLLAPTMEEFRRYRSLFLECVALFDMMGNDLQRTRTTLKDINGQFGDDDLDP